MDNLAPTPLDVAGNSALRQGKARESAHGARALERGGLRRLVTALGSGGRAAVGGALVWQINDCWPVTSWAIVDSQLRPKPAYYVVRPAITVERAGHDALRVRCERPAKGVSLQAGDGVAWGDNMLDLVPGDEQVIAAPGLGDADVRVRFLG